MEGQSNYHDLLQCPGCEGKLDQNLTCKQCGKKYIVRNGVVVMVDIETTREEWEWDKEIVSMEVRNEMKKNYELALSEEIKDAQAKWWNAAREKIGNLKGVIVDVASGPGTMLETLLPNTEGIIFATDVDPNILLSTKMELDLKFKTKKAVYLATNAKKIALRDCSIDYITSFAGTNNIFNVSEALEEFHRILKPGGKAILMVGFVDKDSKTSEAAYEKDLQDSFVRENFVRALKGSGFENVKVEEISSATWNDNKMDLFPMEGDKIYYCVAEAEK